MRASQLGSPRYVTLARQAEGKVANLKPLRVTWTSFHPHLNVHAKLRSLSAVPSSTHTPNHFELDAPRWSVRIGSPKHRPVLHLSSWFPFPALSSLSF